MQFLTKGGVSLSIVLIISIVFIGISYLIEKCQAEKLLKLYENEEMSIQYEENLETIPIELENEDISSTNPQTINLNEIYNCSSQSQPQTPPPSPKSYSTSSNFNSIISKKRKVTLNQEKKFILTSPSPPPPSPNFN